MTMTRAILILLVAGMSLSVSGQTIEVSGTVRDMKLKPVADVIVKVTAGKTTLAFCTTNAKGMYALSYDKAKTKGEPAVLTFSHISYEKEEVTLKGDQRKVQEDMILLSRAVALKEVHVKANPLILMGDTLSYNLSQFLGKGDVTLEDGLKRLPGISVADNGAISYMGQGISKFYIEGLDMLGGRYNLATKNIPADYATQVEVLRHHKARKIDEDEESDAVALNIRLAKKAKFKPFGQPVVGAGVREDDFLGAAGLTGMMFTNKFQLLSSVKFSNHGNFGSYDIIDHYGNYSISTLATDRLPGWGGGRTPLGAYLYETNGYGTLNGIEKVDSTRQVRVNADYTYNHHHNSYETTTTYYQPSSAEGVSLSERSRPLTTVHRPMLELKYEDNRRERYLMETLRLQAQFEQNECPVITDDGTGIVTNQQQRDAKSVSVQNNIWSTIRIGRLKQNLTSDIAFNRAPKVCLTMNGMTQTAQSTTLSTNHSTSFTLNLGKKWRVGLPVRLLANYNLIETGSHLGQQRVGGWNITPSVSPGTEWRSASQKTYVSMGVGLRWMNLNYLSKYDSHRTTLSELFAEPHASLRYTFSGTSELTLSTGMSNSAGDILDLLTVPVQTSYRSTSATSGVIGKSQRWNTSIGYKFQVPFSYFSMDVGASWAQGKHNVLSSQVVSGADVSFSSVLRDSHFKSASGSISLSKNILPITTKLTLTASGSWGSNESMSQNVLLTTYTSGYDTDLRAVVTPISWTEITLSGNYSKHLTRYHSQHDSYDDLRVHASIALYPISSLELRSTYDFVRSQITADNHKTASLLSASAQLKLKRTVWKLTLDNLLNTRQYSYTTFSATDRYTFESRLIGRTALLTCKLKLAK